MRDPWEVYKEKHSAQLSPKKCETKCCKEDLMADIVEGLSIMAKHSHKGEGSVNCRQISLDLLNKIKQN